jgi:hypothetical protein
VWKHTLAVLFPPFNKTSVQNQKLKPAASPRKEKRLFPLKPADRFEKHPLSTTVSECLLTVRIAAADLNRQPIIITGGIYDYASQ